jgi:glycine/D-amino acid oxidase-like deaminating enzyme
MSGESPLPNRPRWDDHPDLDLAGLRGEVEAEVCVVGLGGTGLTCIAEALAQGARTIVGLDAVGIGAGAAGRNGGFLLSGTSDYHHELVASRGRDVAVALTRATMEETQRIAAESPGLVRFTGSLRIASSEEEFADCERQRAQMVADGFPCEPYEGPEGRGILIPTDAAFHPLERCRRIAAAAMKAGARLFGGSRVLAVGDGVARTAQGAVRARQVIVCVDGGLETLFPDLRGRVRTARLQMLATAPAPEVAFTRPVSTRYGFDYWQQLPDGTVVLGGGRDIAEAEEWTTDATPTPRIQEYLTRTLRERLGIKAPVTHRWGATVSYSATGVPVFQQRDAGVQVVGAFNGTGNAVGSLLGRMAAQRALGRPTLLAPPFAGN